MRAVLSARNLLKAFATQALRRPHLRRERKIMKLHLGTLLCVLSAAACSTNKPAEGAYDSSQVAGNDSAAPTQDSQLTPASSDGPTPTVASDSSTSSSSASSATPSSGHHDATHKSADHSAGTTSAPATPPAAVPAPGKKPTDTGVAPDNTKINKRDGSDSALTPGDQQENETDLKITQQIRQAVVGDGSLSFTAKNIKIITMNGKVTLRGPVNTAQERATIEAAARKVAGAGKVDNQLEVKK